MQDSACGPPVAEHRFTCPNSQLVMQTNQAKPARMTQARVPRDGACGAAKRRFETLPQPPKKLRAFLRSYRFSSRRTLPPAIAATVAASSPAEARCPMGSDSAMS
jgi:hypothetical protein